MNEGQVVLSYNHLQKIYSQGPQVVEVLKDINLQILPGDQAAIVGSSGSGKTTLLNLLGGLVKSIVILASASKSHVVPTTNPISGGCVCTVLDADEKTFSQPGCVLHEEVPVTETFNPLQEKYILRLSLIELDIWLAAKRDQINE